MIDTQAGKRIEVSPTEPMFDDFEIEVVSGDPGKSKSQLLGHLKDLMEPKIRQIIQQQTYGYTIGQIDLSYYVSKYLAQYLPSYFPEIPQGTMLDMTVDDLLRAFGYFVLSGSGD
ncbi:MAG: hypothetical protein GXP54_12230 [Deltaproteobacteria bacterium]|nr:hypothetical protein [Deltaproteobacteria bacterium]